MPRKLRFLPSQVIPEPQTPEGETPPSETVTSEPAEAELVPPSTSRAEKIYRWRAIGREPVAGVTPKVWYLGMDVNEHLFYFVNTQEARDLAKKILLWAEQVDKANLREAGGVGIVKVERGFRN